MGCAAPSVDETGEKGPLPNKTDGPDDKPSWREDMFQDYNKSFDYFLLSTRIPAAAITTSTITLPGVLALSIPSRTRSSPFGQHYYYNYFLG